MVATFLGVGAILCFVISTSLDSWLGELFMVLGIVMLVLAVLTISQGRGGRERGRLPTRESEDEPDSRDRR